MCRSLLCLPRYRKQRSETDMKARWMWREGPAWGATGAAGRGAGTAGAVGTEITSASPGNMARTKPGVFNGRRPVMRGYTSSKK